MIYIRAGYVKLKPGRTISLRDIVMEGRDDYKGIVRAEAKQVHTNQACGTDDQDPFCAGIASHVTSPAAAPF